MKKALPSRYSYDAGCTIEKTTLERSPVGDKKGRIAGKERIIGALQKYGFLNMQLIERTAGGKNISVQKAVNALQKQGEIDRYTIRYPDREPDNDIYVLSEEARQIYGVKSLFRYDMTNIPYLLEHLSVAQWHISVIRGKDAKEAAPLYKQIGHGKFITQIPSLIKFRTSLGKSMYICAMSAPKGLKKDDMGYFLTRLLTIDSYLSYNRHRFGSYVITIICESESQIEELSLLLSNMAETQEMYLLYSLDADTGDDSMDPLATLYEVDRSIGQTKLGILKLR